MGIGHQLERAVLGGGGGGGERGGDPQTWQNRTEKERSWVVKMAFVKPPGGRG